jgi:hypothetical protein
MTASTPHRAPPEQPRGSGGVEDKPAPKKQNPARPPETGGPAGPEPTRYGDWEINGRCIDF